VTLLAVAETSTDHPAEDGTGRRKAVREHHGERDPVRAAERHDPPFAIVVSRIVELDIRRRKDQGREREVEPALLQILVAFGGIPVEGHL